MGMFHQCKTFLSKSWNNLEKKAIVGSRSKRKIVKKAHFLVIAQNFWKHSLEAQNNELNFQYMLQHDAEPEEIFSWLNGNGTIKEIIDEKHNYISIV